jgi:hypothetical protein
MPNFGCHCHSDDRLSAASYLMERLRYGVMLIIAAALAGAFGRVVFTRPRFRLPPQWRFTPSLKTPDFR